jgi:hypothetical protein
MGLAGVGASSDTAVLRLVHGLSKRLVAGVAQGRNRAIC